MESTTNSVVTTDEDQALRTPKFVTYAIVEKLAAGRMIRPQEESGRIMEPKRAVQEKSVKGQVPS